jgi:phosphoribosyl 1,2-cyclic phosphodiesterase
MLFFVQMTVLASGSRGNAAVVSAGQTHILVDAGLSCRELLRRMGAAGQDPAALTAILITHEHLDHVAGLSVLARKLGVPVFFTEATHRAWTRMMTPQKRMTYAQWLEQLARERAARNAEPPPNHLPAHLHRATDASAGPEVVVRSAASEGSLSVASVFAAATNDPESQRSAEADCSDDDRPAVKRDPAFLPAVEYFKAGQRFQIGEIEINPFTIPHDAADPCGFVFHARKESLRMAIATDLGYVPPNVKLALRDVDVLLLESNHDLEMLKDGPYPWSVKQRVLSRVGHLSNAAAAEFLLRDYDGGAHTIVLGHLSEQNNLPELARMAAESAIGDRLSLLGNRVVLAGQDAPLEPICL